MSEELYPSLPVLLADDEPQALTSYEIALRYGGVSNIITCGDSRRVISILTESKAEWLILDLLMPYVGGEELLRKVSKDFPHVLVIVVTGVDDVETAVRCMKIGAFDYLLKPLEGERLRTTLERAIAFRELQQENLSLRQSLISPHLERPDAFSHIITVNRNMRSLFRYAEAIARSPKPVLITGETGVGKELMAQALSVLSGRPGTLIAANVAGLDDAVFADTLFGHSKGAFTGADRPRKGMIAQAAGGSLLLDEVGDLSPASQTKLLRLLQENEYAPLGEDMTRSADVRIIATTNRDIHRLQEKGGFRRDLYYRLMTHHIHIPPLRERREDLPLLLDHFLEKAARALNKKKPTPPPELLNLLGAYSFPGNVRELEGLVFDAVVEHTSRMLNMEVFKSRILSASAGNGEAGSEPPAREAKIVFPAKLPSIRQSTELLVDEALKRANGNIAAAAGMLGISHQALRKRLRRGR